MTLGPVICQTISMHTTCSRILQRCPLSLSIVLALASSSYCTTHAAYSSGLSVFPTPSPLFPPFPSLGRPDFSLLPSLPPTRFSPADFQTIQDFPVPHGGGLTLWWRGGTAVVISLSLPSPPPNESPGSAIKKVLLRLL